MQRDYPPSEALASAYARIRLHEHLLKTYGTSTGSRIDVSEVSCQSFQAFDVAVYPEVILHPVTEDSHSNNDYPGFHYGIESLRQSFGYV